MNDTPRCDAKVRHMLLRASLRRDGVLTPALPPALLRVCACVLLHGNLQGEHVLFGVVKWKLDAQLYTLLARYCVAYWRM